MRNSKIRSGPHAITRLCELMRTNGKQEPTACDIAHLLDCDVMDVLREHARLDRPDATTSIVPTLTRDGRFTTYEWYMRDHPELYAEKK